MRLGAVFVKAFWIAALTLSLPALASEDSYVGLEARRADIRTLAAPYAGGGHADSFEALASDSESDLSATLFTAPPLSLPPTEAFLRTLSVLKHLGLPDDADSQTLLESYQGRQTAAGVAALLPILDPTGSFKRFAQSTPTSLDAFQDIDGRAVRDFSLQLASPDTTAVGLPLDSFHHRLLRARNNPPARPLAGLRISIDPGHMGGDFWDGRTGKRVRDNQGRWLSEGVLNLQVALVLERYFEGLGAQVHLTHRTLAPVSPIEYAKLPYLRYAQDYLRTETLQPWFQQLLASGPAGSQALHAAASAHPSIKKIFAESEQNRDQYFLMSEDLTARAEAIRAADADIALVVHFDAATGTVNPRRYSATKVYVNGSFELSELAARGARADLVRHLLGPEEWDASLKLGRAVVGHLHDDLKLPFDGGGGGFSKQVEPGIFSRNLAVSRRVSGRALTYIECLHYNDRGEFEALSKGTHPLEIGGKSYPYSDRLDQVARAILAGVVQFVKGYGR